MKRIQYQLLLAVTRRGWQQVGQQAEEIIRLDRPLAEGYCRIMTQTDHDYEQECSRA